ncbi:MAG: hypothetical protein M1812_006907 [Candelaria pacifica]|nr:MAG: hypothetical protein M1812_006907 [Candelaria pacifica]
MASPRPSAGHQSNNPYYSSAHGGNMNGNEEIQQQPKRYPSPSAAQMGQDGGPFYANPQRMSPAENIQLSAQLSRSAAPNMAPTMPDVEMDGNEMRAQPEQIEQSNTNREVSFDSATAPRKRSKTSRACDECRRKKIRCDATDDTPDKACSNCTRTSAPCQFSRIPQKRGPSKGYIKELADRLITLEHAVRPSTHNDQSYGIMNDGGLSPRQGPTYSPEMNGIAGPSNPRKRTYSVSEGLPNSSYVSNHSQRSGERLPSIGGWSTHNAPRHLYQTIPGLPKPLTHQPISANTDVMQIPSGYRPQYSPNTANGMPFSFFKNGNPGDARGQITGIPYPPGDIRPTEQEQGNNIVEWNEETIDNYYRVIHTTYPLLADSKSQLKGRLANCPLALRKAFLEALSAAVCSSPGSSSTSTSGFQSVEKAAKQLLDYQYENKALRTMATNLIYLQASILLVLAEDQHGPASLNGQSGQPRAESLAGAIGFASSLKLHMTPPDRKMYSEGPIDSDEKLARRAWLILVILDRWHAFSTSSLSSIHDRSVVLRPEDRIVLGPTAYQLAQLSIPIGNLASMFVALEDTMALQKAGEYIDLLLQGQLSLFLASAEAPMDSPNVVSLSYRHVRLLSKRQRPFVDADELLGLAYDMASFFNDSNGPVTLLDHHFAALAALTLADLVDIPETHEGALKMLDGLSHTLLMRQKNSPREDTSTWDFAIRDLIQKKEQQPLVNNRDSLQHLADLAVGESGAGTLHTNADGDSAPVNGGQPIPETKVPVHDWTATTRQGYLTVVAQDAGRT